MAAVVLASGFSRRLGRPKQDVLLAGETLLWRAVRTAQEAGLAPVLAILREGHTSALPPGVQVVINTEAAEGMASSIRAGVRHLRGKPETAGAVLMACDQPLLTAAHLVKLCRDPARVVGSRYGGKTGVPAYFPAHTFSALEDLQGDVGARSLLQGAASIDEETLLFDVDTEADLARAERLFDAAAARP